MRYFLLSGALALICLELHNGSVDAYTVSAHAIVGQRQHPDQTWACEAAVSEKPHATRTLFSLSSQGERNANRLKLMQEYDWDDFDNLHPRACESFHSRYDAENAEVVLPAELHVLRVSVVVHLLGFENTSTYNLPHSVVQSQLDVLNEDFRALAGLPGAAGNDARLEFVLATEDPNGGGMNGVLRYTAEEWLVEGSNDINEMMERLAWDSRRYANLYVTDLGTVIPLGWLTPSGVFVDTRVFGREGNEGYEGNRGRTSTHEFGHYFALSHVFANGCAPGDGIDDTLPQEAALFGCPVGAQSCDTMDPIRNYMGYTDDACMGEFTPQQNNRMRCDLLERRYELLGASEPPFFEADFRYLQDDIGSPTVTFRDLSAGIVGNASDSHSDLYGWRWDFGDGQLSDIRDPRHVYDRNGTFAVTLTLSHRTRSDLISNYTLDVVVSTAEGGQTSSAPTPNTVTPSQAPTSPSARPLPTAIMPYRSHAFSMFGVDRGYRTRVNCGIAFAVIIFVYSTTCEL